MNPNTWRLLDNHFAEIEAEAGRKLTRATEVPSDEEIAVAETELSCVFDDDYAAFLRRYGGATVGPFPVFGLRPVEAMGEPWSVTEVTRQLREQAWAGTDQWYVISDDGFGNPIGLANDGRVMVSDHDAGQISQVARNFEEFLLKNCLHVK